MRTRGEFQRLRAHGTRVRSRLVWCTVVVDPAMARPCVAFAIGRQVGAAVTRNRIRRRVRSCLERRAADLPPGLYLMGAAADVARAPAGHVAASVDALVERVRSVAASPDGAR